MLLTFVALMLTGAFILLLAGRLSVAVTVGGASPFSPAGTQANTNVTTVGNGTLTAAALAAGIVTRSGPTANYTDTFDTAANIIAALPLPTVGLSWGCFIKNTVAFSQTLAASTGVTLAGIGVVSANGMLYGILTVTSTTTVTYTGVGLCSADTVFPLTSTNMGVNFRNLIDGGDFTVNPFQRGTSQAADITSTTTYGPDRWAFKGAAGSALDWSQVADTSVAGFGNSLKWQRKSANADVNPLNMVQALETADSIRLQGQTVTLSFYAKSGANYSGGNLTVQVATGTGTNQTAANLIAGSWTNQANAINSTQALTTTMTRYQFTGTIPANATQAGVLFQWTPTGTAGVDDSITINGVQLEVGAVATPFEHRDIEVELALCQRYYFRATEVNGAVFAMGAPSGANTQFYAIWLPTPMRAAPTVTWTVGGFKLNIDGGGSSTAPTTPAAGSAHSPTIITLTTANTLTAAAHSIALVGTGTTGFIDASADL